MSNHKMFRYTLVWDKVRTTGFLNAKRMPLRRHEDILVFYKKLPTYNPQMVEGGEPSHSRGKKWADKGNAQDDGRIYGKYRHDYDAPSTKTNMKYPTSILQFSNRVQGRLHPTQKPVDLLQYLIKTYTDEGMTVLDNTMGSGSTGVAAVSLNRNFIGMELNENYFKTAKERIEKADRANTCLL
jgi:site-specific DNA-methyltransferase (adenine-specific)